MAAGSTYTLVSSTTTGSSASTVTVSSIPSTYTSLIVVVNTYSTFSSDSGTRMYMYFNGDTGTNYSCTAFETNGSTLYNERQTNSTAFWVGRNNNSYSGNTQKSSTIIQLENYANTSVYKTGLVRWSAMQNGRPNGGVVGLWRSSSAINSISFITDSNMAAGTKIDIYGITAA